MKLAKGKLLAVLLSVFLPSLAFAQTPQLSNVQKTTEAVAKRSRYGVVSVDTSQRANMMTGGRTGVSGFVVSANGHILTNSSGLKQTGETVRVTFAGRVKWDAKVVGHYRSCNLALLQVEDLKALNAKLDSPIKALDLGSSADLRSGQIVFTVANPFGVLRNDGTPAVSMGLITRIGRLSQSVGRFKGAVIETDASVNPGSYGGPLLDVNGKVIGVLSGAYSRQRWHGSAIPIDRFVTVAKELQAGDVDRVGVMGIAVENTRGLASQNGVAIVQVQKDSAAAKAKLQIGDRILNVDGQQIYDASDLGKALLGIPPGESLRLEVLNKAGESRFVNLTLQLGEKLKTDPVELPNILPKLKKKKSRASLGVALMTKNDDPNSLIIDGFRKNSPLKKIGAEKGDILRSLDGQKMQSFDDVARFLARKSGGDKVKVQLERDGWQNDFTVQLLGNKKKRSRLGLRLRPIEGRAGLEIDSVAPNSVAERAKLRESDIIVAYYQNGQRFELESTSDMRQAMRVANRKGKLKIDVERDGWGKTIVLNFTQSGR